MIVNDTSLPLDSIFNYPSLNISRDELSIIYSGPFIVNADMYSIFVREYPDSCDSKFEFIDADNSLSTRFPGILLKLSEIDSRNISAYLRELHIIFENSKPSTKNYSANYRKTVSEFKEFSKFYIDLRSAELSPDLSSIKVSFLDQHNRQHHLEFGVDHEEFSEIFYFKEFDVPKKEDSFLLKRSSNLKELYNLFSTYIDELQPFFDFMDLIDINSTVIDPKRVERKLNYRRILLDKNVSVIITVDPCNISCCPNFTFVGPEKLTEKYQNKLKVNLDKWNNQDHLYEQILSILELDAFPKETVSSKTYSDENLLLSDNDCGICFSSELNGFIPDIVCDNKSCGNVYHRLCLSKWLSSIDSQKYFNNIQGPCPNCENQISCTIVT